MVTQIRRGINVLEVVKSKDVITLRLNNESIILFSQELQDFVNSLQKLIKENE
jgi:hypothetical protein